MKNAFWHKYSTERNNEKIFLREVFATLWRFCLFVTRKAKYTSPWIVTWKAPKQIARQRFYPANSLNRPWLINAFKIRTANFFHEGRRRKQICLKLTLIPCDEVLKSTEFFSDFVEHDPFSFLCRNGRSATDSHCSTTFAVSLSQIISSFCFV